MFNPHTKFEASLITCNEDMKGNVKLTIPVLSHPLWDLGVKHRVHIMARRKAHCQLPISDN